MMAFLAVAAVLFAVLYLKEHMRYRAMNRELVYINKRLDDISYTADNEFVLIPSENTGIKEMSAELNRLLQNFYVQKAGYIQKEKSMKRVLTNISHDLRTPLTVLKGYSELLNARTAYKGENGNMQEMVSKIDEKADELIATIEEYFTISKIESGDMRFSIQEINLSQLCHEIILDYYELLEKKDFEVEIQIEDEPVFVAADDEALRRIIKNLIDNAVKHGGSGRYLAIRLRKEDARVLIEIEDHGEGISEKECGRIFDRNYTLSSTRGGNGLGLTIAKNLVAVLNADIQVVSQPMDKTVFTVSFNCKGDREACFLQ